MLAVPHVRELHDLTPSDVPRFGAKAVHCGILLQAGFAVPPAIAIAFDANERAHLPREVAAWLAARPGVRFAVRSSAPGEDGGGHSFAGVHESILNVNAENVADAIEACVASMTSERARLYRATRGIEDAAGAGVLIQQMIDPVRAGVAFTADPVSGDEETIVINATSGLGDAVVAGSARAEEVRVRKDPHGAQDDIRKLVDVLLRIEALYGAPQDVEWCDDGDTIWIVQSRPITTIPVADGIEWTRANLREVLPDLVPYGVARAIHEMLTRVHRETFGALAPRELGPLLRMIRGRIYFNLTIMRHMARVTGQPEATVLRGLGHSEQTTAAEEAESRPQVLLMLRAFPMLAGTLAFHLRPRRTFARARDEVRRIHDALAALPRQSMSDEEIRAALRQWLDNSWRSMALTLILGGVMMLERVAAVICTKRGIDFDALLNARLASGEKSVTSQQGLDLMALARVAPHEFDVAWARFLAEYGHRGIYETDWSRPRFAEDPSPLRDALEVHRAAVVGWAAGPPCSGPLGRARASDPRHGRLAAGPTTECTWETAWAEAKLRLGLLERIRVRFLLDRVKQMYVFREAFRSELTRGLQPVRAMDLELASRFVARGWLDRVEDAFFLMPEEMIDVRAKSIARARRLQRDAFAAMDAPLLIRPTAETRPRDAAEPAGGTPAVHTAAVLDDRALRGLCVSRGVIEGVIAVLRDASESASMPCGAILVTVATDPSWTPLFTLAAGVITEIGGTVSHAATLARELGVPALANVRDATTRLRDGMRVRLDATGGVVTILD